MYILFSIINWGVCVYVMYYSWRYINLWWWEQALVSWLAKFLFFYMYHIPGVFKVWPTGQIRPSEHCQVAHDDLTSQRKTVRKRKHLALWDLSVKWLKASVGPWSNIIENPCYILSVFGSVYHPSLHFTINRA